MAVTASVREPPTIVVISRCAWTLHNFRLSLIKAVAAKGSRVIALGADGDGYEKRLQEAGVEFRPIPVAIRGMNPVADVWLLFRLVMMMLRLRPDVVHCFTIKPAIFGTLAAAICGVRARVVTITGLGYSFTSAGSWLTRLVGALYRLALSQANVVYFQNSDDRDLFIQRGLVVASKARLCAGSGVDVERFKPAALPIEAGRSTPRFLMIARLIKEKGVHDFRGAARLVRSHYPTAEFWLLGGEDPRNPSALSRVEIDEMSASGDVKVLGATEDVRPFIQQSDVVVLPSYREGLPRSLLEAGAMGRPSIATAVEGCRDVVIDGVTGYLVPPRDEAALAHAMTQFILHPERVAAFGNAARERVITHFDENIVVRETMDAYTALLDRESMDGEPTAPA